MYVYVLKNFISYRFNYRNTYFSWWSAIATIATFVWTSTKNSSLETDERLLFCFLNVQSRNCCLPLTGIFLELLHINFKNIYFVGIPDYRLTWMTAVYLFNYFRVKRDLGAFVICVTSVVRLTSRLDTVRFRIAQMTIFCHFSWEKEFA